MGRETPVPVGFVGKLRHGAAHRARGAAPHLPTGLGQAPFVVFRSPPSIAPAKPSEKGRSEAAREHGEQGGGGGGNAREEGRWKSAASHSRGEKSRAKASSIPGDRVWKQYPGRSVSFGQQPGGTGGPVRSARLGKHCGYFVPSPPEGHGARAAGKGAPSL